MSSKMNSYSLFLFLILVLLIGNAALARNRVTQQTPDGLLSEGWESLQWHDYLKASNTDAGDAFGKSVAISGDTLVVGAFWEDSGDTFIGGVETDNSADSAGAAYVFTLVDGAWVQQAYLKGSNTGATDGFGTSVAISGDTLVVGAAGEDSNQTGIDGAGVHNAAINSGAAYVFTRTNGVWSQQAYLKASNTDPGDSFGISVSISGDTLAVGALGEDSEAKGIDGDEADNSATGAGAVYVFTRTEGVWSQQAYVKASNTEMEDRFGEHLDISGDTLVVGAYGEDSNATGVGGNETDNSANSAGAVYVFTRNEGVWSQQTYLKASNSRFSARFGSSVAISGNTLAIGAMHEASNTTGVNSTPHVGANNSGAAYIFTLTDGIWSQQAYLKASNTGADDRFGESIAISGDILVVGASWEKSSATGVGGDQTNNSVNNSGAAYVFTRSENIWSQEAYLKASNAEAGDHFGGAIAISGDTLIIGALSEDSSATGINGDETDNSATQAGAVYAYSIPQKFQINAGLNDAWYDPATDGQGFFITVFPDINKVSLAWFTYDTELPPEDAESNLGDAGHRWITALGKIVDNQVVMNITITSGGIFDTPTDVQRTNPKGSDGTLILTFDNCYSGTVEYNITSIGRKGVVPIQRIADDNVALCEVISEELRDVR